MSRAESSSMPCHRGSLRWTIPAGIGLLACLLGAPPSRAAPDGWPSARATAAHAVAPDAAQRAAARVADGAGEQWQEQSLGALAKESWRWVSSIPVAVSPFVDNDGTHCGINQQGRFWHLLAPLDAVRSCVVPAGRPLVVPVFAGVNDYPCPDPAFQPAAGQSVQEFLLLGLAPLIDSVATAEARLDGRALRVRRITTDVFSFTGAASLAAIDSCITGSPQLAVSDGYWALIEPLPPGDHVLQLQTTSVFGTLYSQYTLKVRRVGER